jgi:hypothetical protein
MRNDKDNINGCKSVAKVIVQKTTETQSFTENHREFLRETPCLCTSVVSSCKNELALSSHIQINSF